MKKVTIIDYKLGNLFSVKQACETVGINAKISNYRHDIENADALILPGVGAFNEAMQNLGNLEIIEVIRNEVLNGKPFFGVCLGLQLLFSKSEEFGSGNGLNLIPGIIKKFPSFFADDKVKVPQIAWNNVYSNTLIWQNTALQEIKQNEFMYFVHSYYVNPVYTDIILTKTNYSGIEYCSSILKDNIFATQFHPEKSGEKGLSIYKNWAQINKII